MRYILLISGGYFLAFISWFLRHKYLEPVLLRFMGWFILVEYLIQVMSVSPSFFYQKSNYYLLNILCLITYSFYLFLFSEAIYSGKIKTLILAAVCLFWSGYMFEVFYVGSFFRYLTFSDSLGRALVFAAGFMYLFQSLSKEDLIPFLRIPLFWICSGILFSIAGSWIYTLFFTVILEQNADHNGQIIYALLITTNNLQYLLFTIGFLCNAEWKRNR